MSRLPLHAPRVELVRVVDGQGHGVAVYGPEGLGKRPGHGRLVAVSVYLTEPYGDAGGTLITDGIPQKKPYPPKKPPHAVCRSRKREEAVVGGGEGLAVG